MDNTSAISSLGVGSGIDAAGIVSKLVEIENKPITVLKAQASKVQAKISAYGQVQSAVSAVRDAARKLTSVDLWASTTATSADSTAVSASSGSTASAGSYNVVATTLAKAQSIYSNTAVATSASALGSGSLRIELGAWDGTAFTQKTNSTAIDISIASDDTLDDIRQTINASGAGVTASIINDAGGARLVIQSNSTGLTNGFRITATDDDADNLNDAGISALAYDLTPGSESLGTTRSQAAVNASASINGVPVNSESNTLSEVITGMTLTLSKESATPVTITVAQDTATISKTISDFATAYSSLASLLTTQTKYDSGTKTAGTLQGDSGAVSVQSQLRAILVDSSGASSVFTTLSSVGLQITATGGLTVNSTKLTSALSNLSEVKKLFSNTDTGNASNDGILTRLRTLSDNLLSTDGTLSARTSGLKETIDANQKRQDTMAARVALYEKRLRAQYTALDTIMANLNGQSSYVTQMVNSFNKSS